MCESSTPRRRPFEASSSPQLPRSRDLIWDGCLNVRDLGGHPTEDGTETRFGSVVRADSISQLSPQGWKALAEVDHRPDSVLREREDDPPRELEVDVHH